MSTDTLTDLLNKVRAMVKCGASTYPLLAQETKIPAKQLWDILNRRRARPNGARTLALYKWAGQMTVELSKKDDKTQRRYRSAYREACRRFPGNGRD